MAEEKEGISKYLDLIEKIVISQMNKIEDLQKDLSEIKEQGKNRRDVVALVFSIFALIISIWLAIRK